VTLRTIERVLIVIAAIVLGLVAGRMQLTGPHAARPDVLWLPALGAGVAARVAASTAGDDAAVAMLAASIVLLVIFAAHNRHLVGMGVIAIGLLANLVAVLANDGMPVRPGALVAAGIADRSELATVDVRAPRHLEGAGDRLAILGDVLPIPGAQLVVSFGDLIVAAGLADVVGQLTRRRRRAHTTSAAKVAHDWGTAPNPSPESGSHHSAKPEIRAPAQIASASASATRTSPDLVDATHSR
jgi:hypothetical protein